MLYIKPMKNKPHVFIVVDSNDRIKKYAYSKEEAQDYINKHLKD